MHRRARREQPDHLLNSAPSSPGTASVGADDRSDPFQLAFEINASNFAQTAGIPAVAARQVRVYQRIIYLQ